MSLNRRAFLLSGTVVESIHRLQASPKIPEGMVAIPAAQMTLGTPGEAANALAERYGVHPSWLRNETERTVRLESFAIDRYAVTHRSFLRFCESTAYDWPLRQEAASNLAMLGDLPVVNVNIDDCMAYAAWAKKRLPSEDEWEYAARGPEGFVYPWGNSWDAERCNCNRDGVPGGSGLLANGRFPSGASPFGIEDMAGNVCEWTSSAYAPASHVVKGGFWKQREPWRFRSAARLMSQLSTNRQDYIGFRCAQKVEE